MEKIKFVIVGSGNIANTYISAVGNIQNAEVVAIVSRSEKTLAGLPSFQQLSEIELNYHAVIICTPNGYHHQNTIEAAELGKHVLCEKPIGISLDSIDQMIESCKAQDVRLAVAYQRRFSSDNPLVKELIEANKLGKIFSVDLSIKNYRDDAYYDSAAYRGTYEIDGGGPFIQQASHYIDLYYWFFGKPQKLVSMLGTFVHDIEVEDHGAVICQHESGLIGTITASTATKPGFPGKLEIYTDKGYLIMENDKIIEWGIEGVLNPVKDVVDSHEHTGSSNHFVNDTSNHEILIKDFIQSVRTGNDPLVTGESAKNSTAIILDIYNNQF